MRKHILFMAALVCFLSVAAAEKPAPLTAAAKLANTRIIAANQPGKALKDWMTKGAYHRWQSVCGGLVAPDDSSPMVADFFSHALLLTGREDAQSGIYAFYNPLQDNILLIQTDNQETVPRIEDFVFMTGTDFRGETLEDQEYPQAIALVRGDLDAVLLKNISEVSKIFHAAFPADAKGTPSLAGFRKFADSADKVAANAALRFALLKRFTLPEANDDALKAAEYAELLWSGDSADMIAVFEFPKSDTYGAEAFVKFPKPIRESMIPVVYFRDKTGSVLFGFASPLMPELLVLIRAPKSGNPLFVFLPLAENFAAAK